MKIIGQTTIHPFLFYTGKIAGYITWIISLISIFGFSIAGKQPNGGLINLSYLLFAIGLFFTVLSLFNLGRSTRLGLPQEDTKFITSGLYKLSRNPMYLGFDLLTIASIIFTGNLIILIAGIYSLVIYHLIIAGEEKFLEKRFKESYLEYKKKVRRYL